MGVLSRTKEAAIRHSTIISRGGLHWVAAEPPSDGLRCATWSTEIRSASTV